MKGKPTSDGRWTSLDCFYLEWDIMATIGIPMTTANAVPTVVRKILSLAFSRAVP